MVLTVIFLAICATNSFQHVIPLVDTNFILLSMWIGILPQMLSPNSGINRYPNVLIGINNARKDLPWSYMWTENIKLPAENISNWLNYNFDNVQETKNQTRKKRLLELCMHRVSFENARAVCNQMKKVYLTNLEQKKLQILHK